MGCTGDMTKRQRRRQWWRDVGIAFALLAFVHPLAAVAYLFGIHAWRKFWQRAAEL